MAIDLNNKTLVTLLTLHPWLNAALLVEIMGEQKLSQALVIEEKQIQSVQVPDYGTCYALGDELLIGILSLRRIQMVRDFVLNVMGAETFFRGGTPTANADGEFLWEGRWYRIWGDIGFAAPESLRFVRKPPSTFGPQVNDIVVVPNANRADMVAAQVERNWGGRKEVFIWTAGTEDHKKVKPISRSGKEWKIDFNVNELVNARTKLLTRKMVFFNRGNMREKEMDEGRERILAKTNGQNFVPIKVAPNTICPLEKVFLNMGKKEWNMLVFIGNNPMWNRLEIIQTLGVFENAGPSSLTIPGDGIDDTTQASKRLDILKHYKLVSDVKVKWKNQVGRHMVNWRGMELLMEDWGVDTDDFGKFHPWPTNLTESGHRRYSQGWLSKMLKHQSLCRQFALSLVLTGRRISNAYGGAEAEIITTIGSRIFFQDTVINDRIQWISPDASLNFTLYQNPVNKQGGTTQVLSQHLLYVEIDRATNSLSRVAEKFDKYKYILGVGAHGDPVLVWVIDGGASREKYLLDEMNRLGIPGWTVTVGRLLLSIRDPWWEKTYVLGGNVKSDYDSVGGLAPYRKIWMSTKTGYDLLPLLNYEPWTFTPLSIREGRPPQIYETYRY